MNNLLHILNSSLYAGEECCNLNFMCGDITAARTLVRNCISDYVCMYQLIYLLAHLFTYLLC